MAASFTIDSQHHSNARIHTDGSGNLGVYATGGIAVTANDLKLGIINHLRINATGGVVFEFDKTNSKIKAFRSPARTHGHDLSIIGGQGAAGTDTVTAPAATDLLGKEEAGDALIAKADVATKGGVVGETLAEAALAEVANAVDLTATVFRFEASGAF